jgi:hypothetical protein
MRPGAFHDIGFAVEGSDETFVISTTRPELLPACVGVTAHPALVGEPKPIHHRGDLELGVRRRARPAEHPSCAVADAGRARGNRGARGSASLAIAVDALTTINRGKTERGAGGGRVVERLVLRTGAAPSEPVLLDVLASARVREHTLELAEGTTGFEITVMDLAPKLDAPDPA